ncbi:hypothetical protein M3Y98_00708300 [Aphelenchoides besseyi]|nr:hypothetical protein M3Y98_00708300 [Aphelenchoides besseyi]KAI6210355.1 hypothetical protein M3Y96_00319500 [Aphelenchoides besseyi]
MIKQKSFWPQSPSKQNVSFRCCRVFPVQRSEFEKFFLESLPFIIEHSKGCGRFNVKCLVEFLVRDQRRDRPNRRRKSCREKNRKLPPGNRQNPRHVRVRRHRKKHPNGKFRIFQTLNFLVFSQRSASTSSSRTPRKKTDAGSPKRGPTPQERGRSQSKSPPKTTPRKPSSRSRSSSRSSVVAKRTSPLHVIQTKIQKATTDIKKHAPNLFSSSAPRSRRAIHDAHYGNDGGTTTSHYLRHRVVPSIWQRGRATVQRYTRRFAFNVKRHLKRHWRKYLVVGGLTAAAYYSYHNQRAVQRAIQEQYNKLAALLEQQKETTFSKYFNGWSSTDRPPPTTTEVPVIIQPKVVEEPPQPHPIPHSTVVV